MNTIAHERTLVLCKPDTVQRGLVGEILTRFEKKGLKIVAMKMVLPSKELARKHYAMPESDQLALAARTKAAYEERGETFDTDPIEYAQGILRRLERYLTAGPVVALVIEGAHAVSHIRKIRGATNPLNADIGSISADLSIDSYFLADPDERAIRNLVHASGSVEESAREIALWFKDEEIFDYELAIEQILYSKKWEEVRVELTEEN